MKNLNGLLLIVFLLSSCAPAATTVPTFTPQPTETITPSPTATQTPSPTPTMTPTPTPIGGGSGKLIFEYYRVAFEKLFPDLRGEVNIFISSIDGTDLIAVTNGLKGFNRIESISADGQLVLISSRSSQSAKGDLYLIHLDSPSDPIKLGNGLVPWNAPQSIFLDNTRVVYSGQGTEGNGFYMVNIDGTNLKKMSSPEAKVFGIMSSDETRIYWDSFQKEDFGDSARGFIYYGDFEHLWWTNIDGSEQGKLEADGNQIIPAHFAFSPDGTKIAWIPVMEPNCDPYYYFARNWTPFIRNGTHYFDMTSIQTLAQDCFILHIASLSNMDSDMKIPLIPPFNPAKDDFAYHSDYLLKWWPDNSKMLAFDNGGRWIADMIDYPIALYEVAPNDANPMLSLLKVLSHGPDDYFGLFGFSPDGRQILLGKYGQGPYINIVNLETTSFKDDFGHTLTPDSQVGRIGNIYWLP